MPIRLRVGRGPGRTALLLGLVILGLGACHRGAGEERPAAPVGEAELTRRFLADNRARYLEALRRTGGWLDAVQTDPAELRAHGIKGKKKLAELLDAYAYLERYAPEADRAHLRERFAAAAAVTGSGEYHDMARIGDHEFKEDATSYLRVGYLMDRMGLDTSRYREEIAQVQPRLDAHLRTRGSHQLMVFHWYYQHFGLAEPFDLAGAFTTGIIRSRPAAAAIDTTKAYGLTHEIFVPYHYGEDLDAKFFTAEDQAYLRPVLEELALRYRVQGDPDIEAELVSCQRFLGFTDSPGYRDALAYLLDAQRPDGSWGDYERLRPRFGDYVRQGFYLHTTSVAIEALTVAFEAP
jgi:hypothetical protein